MVDPDDTVGFTEGRGINNPRTVAGNVIVSDGPRSLVFTVGGTSRYDLPGALQTNLLRIDEPGDLPARLIRRRDLAAFIDRGRNHDVV